MKKYDYTLLIVEDSHMINSALCSYLEKSHNPSFDLQSAFTLTQAKDILKDQKIDFVVLDLELSDGRGEDLIDYINTLGVNTKTVVLTENVENKRRQQLFQMGIIDYLSKENPINFLNNEIIKLINDYNSHKNVRILVGDDSPVYLEHVKSILENHTYNVEEVRKKEKPVKLNNCHAQIGKMISVLTHQWKQPLQGINLASDYIRQIYGEDEDTLEIVEVIQEQVRFLTETMDQFKNFFKSSNEQTSFSAVGTIEILLKMLGDIYENTDITLEGEKELYIQGYPNEFYQIVVHLLNNAQDAFDERKCEERKIKISVAQDKDKAVIMFCDNAGGIPEEIEGDKGRNIGLDISDIIIKKMNGTITVENSDKGACSTIVLPLNAVPEGVE